ncbi:hypothetical protein ACPPVU_08985 [Mucilaginibacter sp. McL0603]|uniref:hypothetical protein n=1 Tax=Mucilaginibacter sp. McL0603 TaxID=3415670 RepID=UPI003CFA82A2
MSIDKFNNRILDIEARHKGDLKGKRIFSYFEVDAVRSTTNYIIDIDPKKELPQRIRDEIQEAYNQFLSK